MPNFQLDRLSALPGLDPAALATRVETRRDDSFDEHLRRFESAPPSREDRSPPVDNAAPSRTPKSGEAQAPEHTTREIDESAESASQAESDTSGEGDEEKLEQVSNSEGTAVAALSQAPHVSQQTAEARAVVEAIEVQVGDEETGKSADKTRLAAEKAQPLATSGMAADAAVDESLLETEISAGEASPILERTVEKKTGGSAVNADAKANKLDMGAAAQAEDGTTNTLANASTNALPAAPVISESTPGRRERSAGVKAAERQGELPATLPVAGASPSAEAAAMTAASQVAEGAAKGAEPKSAATTDSTPAPSNSTAVPLQQGRLPPHVLGRAGERERSLRPLSEVDQARFVNRVARAFQTVAGQEGELRLRLSPPELGALRLEVKVLSGVMTARIETETSAARALLVEHLPALRERLAEQNIRLEQFDIDLMNRQSGGQPSGTPQDQGREAFGASDAAARFRLAEEPPEEQPAPRVARPAGNGQLNVLV